MRTGNRRIAAGVTVAAAAATLVVGAAVQAASPSFTPVPNAQPRVTGISVPNALPPELADVVIAQGANVLENPDGTVTNYGYYNDGTFVPTPGGLTEATKSEPDKNTYLVMRGLRARIPSTTTARTSCSRATRAARPGTSPASTSTPTTRTVSRSSGRPAPRSPTARRGIRSPGTCW